VADLPAHRDPSERRRHELGVVAAAHPQDRGGLPRLGFRLRPAGLQGPIPLAQRAMLRSAPGRRGRVRHHCDSSRRRLPSSALRRLGRRVAGQAVAVLGTSTAHAPGHHCACVLGVIRSRHASEAAYRVTFGDEHASGLGRGGGMGLIRKSRAVGTGVRSVAIMHLLGERGRYDRLRSYGVVLQASGDSVPEPLGPRSSRWRPGIGG